MIIFEKMPGDLNFKVAIFIKNAFAHVFINRYPKYFQSDYWKEFVSQTLEIYLENIEIEHIIGSPNYPQSQGVIKEFNKIIQRALPVAYDNIIQENLLEI